MINWFFKFLFFSLLLNSFLLSAEILAVVNGENITTDVAPKNFKTLDAKKKKVILNRLIEKRLAIQYALQSDVVNSDDYKKALKHILQMSGDKSKNENLANLFKKDSSIDGYTTEQLNSKKGLLAFDFILNNISKTMKISETKLKKYYELNKYKYDTPAMTELLTIVVNDKKLADKIIIELENSKDTLQAFSKLAKKYSLAPSANDNGYFGKIPLQDMNEAIKPYVKNLKRGEFTKKPIKTAFGYQVFYILNNIPEYNSTFKGVKNSIEDELLRKEVKSWAMKKIKELKKSAEIKINTKV